MKVKTSKLTGVALDWVVAQIEGDNPEIGYEMDGTIIYGYFLGDEHNGSFLPYSPSTNWSQAGHIIERELLSFKMDGGWYASSWNDDGRKDWYEGPTPLIALMRCYVDDKLGYEVEIPKELL